MEGLAIFIDLIVGVVLIWGVVTIAGSTVRNRRANENILKILKNMTTFVNSDSPEEIKRKAEAYDRHYN